MAEADFFLKIDTIDGESTDSKHKGEIDVINWSWGEDQSGTMAFGGGGGAGKVTMDKFRFVMRVCKASPKLMSACATGQHIKSAVLTCRKAGGEQQEYFKVKMSDVLVASYRISGSDGDGVPLDEVALDFSKIELEYKAQKPDGSLDAAVTGGYNVKERQKV